jgi:tRNA(Leu) C34 or U34 (ribose-2'-O)-methylase TrmL
VGILIQNPTSPDYVDNIIRICNENKIDAVKALGKFQTVVALVENATTNYAKVEITRKKLISKLQKP